jgi:ethanolamine transporter EutH
MNNPPAFPYSFPDGPRDSYNVAYGMTLRDYFAAKAMQGLLTIPIKELSNDLSDEYPRLDSYVSYLSFAMADAMLKAREA